MNSFGKILRISIFGESHGKNLGIVIDGCPAGVSIEPEDFADDLERRKGGGPGTTSRKEDDIPFIQSGVFNGRTTGAPILISFENKNIQSNDYENIRYTPRPGHADFVAYKKYGAFNDYRGGGHFSGRLTVGLVAAGVVAKKLIKPVKVESRLIGVGRSNDSEHEIKSAMGEGDSVGGIIECKVAGLPIGLGEPFFDSVESLISHIVFSIPAVKGIEFGAGFSCSHMRGSEYNDRIVDMKGTTITNKSGGINGGITNGNEVYFRVAVRPTASIMKKQSTVDLRNGGETAEIAVAGRHDACIALRIPVVLEAVTALVFADLILLEQKIERVIR